MKYTLTHGGIAAVLTVTPEQGEPFDCICINERETVVGVGSDGRAKFEALPLEVRAAVNKQFGAVFSLPVSRRSEWVVSQEPFTVEAA